MLYLNPWASFLSLLALPFSRVCKLRLTREPLGNHFMGDSWGGGGISIYRCNESNPEGSGFSVILCQVTLHGD